MNTPSTARQLLITHDMYDAARQNFVTVEQSAWPKESSSQAHYRKAAEYTVSWMFSHLEAVGENLTEVDELFLHDELGVEYEKDSSEATQEEWEQARDQAVAETLALLIAAFKRAAYAANLHGHACEQQERTDLIVQLLTEERDS